MLVLCGAIIKLAKTKKKVKTLVVPGVFDHIGPAYTSVHTKIDKELAYWLPVMNLDRWCVSVNYEPTVNDNNSDICATMNSSWCYKQATMTVYVPTMAKMPDIEIEYILVHELCHAMVCAMRGKKHRMEMEESVVTELSRAFMKTRYPTFVPRS